jgi:hypothetical protein
MAASLAGQRRARTKESSGGGAIPSCDEFVLLFVFALRNCRSGDLIGNGSLLRD